MDYDFEYTYYAQNKNDVLAIRDKYANNSETFSEDLEKLISIDKSTTSIVTILIVIILTASFIMFIIGFYLFLTTSNRGAIYFTGLILGFLGFLGMILTMPLSRHLKNKYRKKNTQEVLDISDKILGES